VSLNFQQKENTDYYMDMSHMNELMYNWIWTYDEEEQDHLENFQSVNTVTSFDKDRERQITKCLEQQQQQCISYTRDSNSLKWTGKWMKLLIWMAITS